MYRYHAITAIPTWKAAAYPHTRFTRCDWPRQLDSSAVTITRMVTGSEEEAFKTKRLVIITET
jgi:hypothetical protein